MRSIPKPYNNRIAGARALNERSEATRHRLIEAGVDLFGQHGYEATTTRELAEASGVNLAAIPYHFGGKDGLYHAVAEAVIEGLHREMDGFLNAVGKEMVHGVNSPHQAMALIEWLMEDFAEIVLTRPQVDRWISFMLREKMEPTDSFAVIYDSPVRRMRQMIVRLLAEVSGMDRDSVRLRLTAIQLQGLVYVFRTARATTMREMGWVGIDENAYDELRGAVLENTRLILRGLQARP